MKPSLISIIVPIYKVEPYLDRCVRSIVEQTYENLEIILVDDGSPDNCPAICDAWAAKDSRIRVIHKENGGLSDARNAGMDIAAGDYIAFVDSDDWVSPDYINAMHQAVKKSGAEIAACDVLISYGETEPDPCRQDVAIRVCSPEEAIGDILEGKGFRAVAWNKLYKRTLLENERFPVGKYHEDEFLTYRILAKADKLVYVDCPLYAYFQRPGSIMNSASMKHLDALDAYLERLEFLRCNYPALYKKDKAIFCFACVGFYRTFLRAGAEMKRCREKIRTLRKQIRFRSSDFHEYTKKQRAMVFCSRYLIGAFSFALNVKERWFCHE